MPGGVWAVLSVYRPTSAPEALPALRDQVDGIVVVDDGSGGSFDPVLAAIAASGVVLLRQPDNMGIAAALNRGIAHALEAGADAVVTFDQDSDPGPGFVDALLRARDDAASRGHRVGAVVPEHFAGVRQVHRVEADGTLRVRSAIQSGMLLERWLLSDIGMLREDLFIDLVDTEYVLRIATSGHRIVAAPGLRLPHSLGRRYRLAVLGVPLPPATLSTPFRYYYRARNRVVITREYWRALPLWVARDTIVDALHFAQVWWLARPRREMGRLLGAALADARRTRLGRMSDALADVADRITWNAEELEERRRLP